VSTTPDLICSLALERLGHTPFTTFASTGDLHAKAAERLWPTVRDSVLARHPWNFAIRRVLIATPDVTPPAFDFLNRFALPVDWLRTLTVGEQGHQPEYRVEGGFILVNFEADLPLRYVARIETVTLYPQYVRELLVYAVAARLAYRVTQSTSKSDAMHGEFERFLMTATALDGVEDSGETLGDFPLIAARFG
jgi:hypothetical protein